MVQVVRLRKSALQGNNTIQVNMVTDWNVGDFIAIASTSQNYDQYEKVQITAISSDTISFTPALIYNHFGDNVVSTTKGQLDMRAEVILLTRNVKISGDSVGNWGCTIQTIGYYPIDSNSYVQGNFKANGLQIEGCGHYNQLYGALAFVDVNQGTEANLITNLTINDSLGISFSATNSKNIKVLTSNFYNAQKTGVVMREVS